MTKSIRWTLALAGGLVCFAAVGWAGELAVDPYVSFRAGRADLLESSTDPAVSLDSPTDEPPLGLSLGANVGRYWGVELAADFFETSMKSPLTGTGTQEFGEIGIWTVLAQARGRYPVWNDRLQPYGVVGLGAGFAEFNDRNALNFRFSSGGGLETSLVGSVGLGLEYFVADNIALGVEGRYLHWFGSPQVAAGGQSRDVDLDAVITTVGLRVFLSGGVGNGTGAEENRPARDGDALRGYLALRGGANIYTAPDDVPSQRIDNRAELLGGAAVGVNFNKYVGAELAGEFSEAQLVTPGVGKSAEYSLWTVLGQVRLRYPLWDDRFSPYLIAGGGLGFGELNDREVPFFISGVSGGRDTTFIGSAGAGFDYFIAHNLALTFEAKRLFNFKTDITVNGVRQDLNLDSVAVSGGLRVLFP